jgi:muconolactone delta-isomerase
MMHMLMKAKMNVPFTVLSRTQDAALVRGYELYKTAGRIQRNGEACPIWQGIANYINVEVADKDGCVPVTRAQANSRYMNSIAKKLDGTTITYHPPAKRFQWTKDMVN